MNGVKLNFSNKVLTDGNETLLQAGERRVKDIGQKGGDYV